MKEPKSQTVRSLLGGENQYRAPVFQRYYEWGDKQVDELLNDIREADPKRNKEFLGAIVNQTLPIDGTSNAPKPFLMIDGQQRLTTIYLVLVALAVIDQKFGSRRYAQRIRNTYLTYKKHAGSWHGAPKLVPTLQDRESFWRVLQDNVDEVAWDESTAPPGEGRRNKIGTQWKRIYQDLTAHLLTPRKKFKTAEFRRILKNVEHGLEFVEIPLEPSDDANEIFGRLNSKGVPLRLSDLVRNEAFARFPASNPSAAQSFYDNYWRPFEESFPPKSFDAYFPIFSIIVSDGKVTQADAFSSLQSRWRKKKAARQILNDLNTYSEYFSALYEYQKITGLSKSLNDAVERFSRMPRTTVVWPFIIRMLHAVRRGSLTSQKAVKNLKTIESFLVRRSLIGKEPTGLHAVFKVLWSKTKGDPKKVLRNITSSTIDCPNNQEVRDYLRAENVATRKILKFIFMEREAHLVKKFKWDSSSGPLSIEHIMPQKMNADWKRRVSRESHNLYVDTLGNLTPLTGKQNSSAQNEAWSKKRVKYQGSDWKMTRMLAANETWDEMKIKARTKRLTNWIVKRWCEVG
jgi:hypothetical protein